MDRQSLPGVQDLDQHFQVRAVAANMVQTKICGFRFKGVVLGASVLG